MLDQLDLMQGALATEQSISGDELAEETAHCPDICCRSIVPPHKDLWWPIPSRTHVSRHVSSLACRRDLPCESKVTESYITTVGEQDVGGLEVAMYDIIAMKERDHVQELPENDFSESWVQPMRSMLSQEVLKGPRDALHYDIYPS